MGYELWYSQRTGIRRKGTTFSEFQELFIANITTNQIYEPLANCRLYDDPFEVRESMEKLDFDVLGVSNEGKIVGYIRKQDIGEEPIENNMSSIRIDLIISDSTPIAELIDILSDKEYVFVLCKNEISGIVTKADIDKPIVRIYLFGIISLYELHLNYWIQTYHKVNHWNEKLKADRLDFAKKVFEERKGNNLQLTLLECIQLSDKKEILRNTDKFLLQFNYSKKEFKSLLEKIERLRNELAHSQNSIISSLKWKDFINSIKAIKDFLSNSELEVTK